MSATLSFDHETDRESDPTAATSATLELAASNARLTFDTGSGDDPPATVRRLVLLFGDVPRRTYECPGRRAEGGRADVLASAAQTRRLAC